MTTKSTISAGLKPPEWFADLKNSCKISKNYCQGFSMLKKLLGVDGVEFIHGGINSGIISFESSCFFFSTDEANTRARWYWCMYAPAFLTNSYPLVMKQILKEMTLYFHHFIEISEKIPHKHVMKYLQTLNTNFPSDTYTVDQEQKMPTSHLIRLLYTS